MKVFYHKTYTSVNIRPYISFSRDEREGRFTMRCRDAEGKDKVKGKGRTLAPVAATILSPCRLK